jgi:fructose-1,6-bisphosphatase
MRWAGAFVADAHRVLMSGGVCLYPRDSRDANREGRIRLLYEASPIAMLIEQAGGLATTGRERLLEIAPKALHERVGVILGSRSEVERIGAYHLAHDTGEDRPFRSPLFTDRSLYRPERGHCGRAATCPQSTL